MKNIIKLSLLFFVGFFFSSCEEEDLTNNILQSEGYVYFATTNSGSTSEVTNIVSTADGNNVLVNNLVELTLLRTGNQFSEDLTVGINVEVTYQSTTDFQNEGDDASSTIVLGFDESVTIPANEPSAIFSFTILDDVLSAGNKVATFSIASVSNSYYAIGFPGAEVSQVSHTVVIEDDDCPIDVANQWVGIWEVAEMPAAPGSFNDGFSIGAAVGLTVEMVLDESNPAGTSVILLPDTDPNRNSLLLVGNDMPMNFNTCPGTVLIGSGTYQLSFLQSGTQATILRSDEPGEFGNGTFAEDASTFTITASYSNLAAANFDEFNIKFVKVVE